MQGACASLLDEWRAVVPSRCTLTVCSARRAQIFLAYTSNLVSSGVRESIRYLAQHGMVQVMVTTAGGIEEDLIKARAAASPVLSLCRSDASSAVPGPNLHRRVPPGRCVCGRCAALRCAFSHCTAPQALGCVLVV